MTVRTWLINLCCRNAYRLAYPLAKVVWCITRHNAVAIAVWVNDRVLLVRHSYKPGLGVPKGGVKRGEDARIAAARELKEETGLALRPSALSAVTAYSTLFGRIRLYETRLDQEPMLHVNDREIVYAGFHPVDDVTDRDRTVMAYLRKHATHLI